jgi:hypothetical protein
MDLNNTYQSVSGEVFKQIHGCPIGGNLSGIYANVLCAFQENEAIRKLGTSYLRVAGIRQVDDLLLFLAYDKRNSQSLISAEAIRREFLQLERVYKGGLELEEQQPLTESRNLRLFKFAGTKVLVDTRKAVKLHCEPFLKNETSLLLNGSQSFPRFFRNSSYALRAGSCRVFMELSIVS